LESRSLFWLREEQKGKELKFRVYPPNNIPLTFSIHFYRDITVIRKANGDPWEPVNIAVLFGMSESTG
jgi:hypothetical protein